MIIAIDGPAGSGKSTVAKLLSHKLQMEYIDSGAIYRTLTLYAINEFKGVVEGNEAAVFRYFEENHEALSIFWENHVQQITLHGVNVSEEIRTRTVTKQIKYIANHHGCRNLVNKRMQELADRYSFVIDGRDIGTVVFPNARYKFFLEALPEIRAKRRARDLNLPLEGAEFDRLCREIALRDEEDKNRKIAPLQIAADAVLIDTSSLNIEEVVKKILDTGLDDVS